MVSLNEETNALEWPLAFCYPEYEIMDFQQKVSENATIYDCLVALFTDFELGRKDEYTPDNVNIYHENKKSEETVKLDIQKTIKEILGEKTFAVQQGTLVFYVLVKDSETEEVFIKMHKKLLAKVSLFVSFFIKKLIKCFI